VVAVYLVAYPDGTLEVQLNLETEFNKFISPIKLTRNRNNKNEYIYHDGEEGKDFDIIDVVAVNGERFVAMVTNVGTLKIPFKTIEDVDLSLDILYQKCNPILSQEDNQALNKLAEEIARENDMTEACRVIRSYNFMMLKQALMRAIEISAKLKR
jgi:hypothetical protein